MDRLIAYAGAQRRVVFAVCADGSSPAAQFFDRLGSADKAKMLKLYQYLADHGWITNPEKFKKIAGTDFFEFKSFQVRMPCFFAPGRLVIVTHGFLKKGDRIPPQELERARRIRQEDEARGTRPV